MSSLAGPSDSGHGRPKRAQVPAACRACQRSKTKCDALRPCTPCAQRARACEYDNNVGESYVQAHRRKHKALVRANDEYVNLVHLFRSRKTEDAHHMLYLLRKGWTPLEISQRASQTNNALLFRHSRQSPLHVLLGTLAHSTSSTEEIVRLTTSAVLEAMSTTLPSPTNYLVFRDRIVQPHTVQNMIFRSLQMSRYLPLPRIGSVAGSETQSNDSRVGIPNITAQNHDGTCKPGMYQSNGPTGDDIQPLFSVKAAPWTSVTQSDEAVSHLVSLFLAWLNPTWRFVEQDLFLRGMQSQRLEAMTCTPFLVNSICAIASLHTEHEVAFSIENPERINRGKHFHDEATRLWALEADKASIPNAQALCILALDSNFRAIDRLGLKLISRALEIDNELAVEQGDAVLAENGLSPAEFARLRLATHITATSTHTIMRIAFMSRDEAVEATATGFPDVADVYPDRIELWQAYPLDTSLIAWRPTIYLTEYYALAKLLRRMYDLVLRKPQDLPLSNTGFALEAEDLLQAMESWHKCLPFELQYHWPMSNNVWELHATYLIFTMVLTNSTKGRLAEPTDSGTDPVSGAFSAQAWFQKALTLAQRATDITRDFRERYGFKILPAELLLMQAVAGGILLQDPELSRLPHPTMYLSRDPDSRFSNSHTAFEEVYRCLLAGSMEGMIARGIARMMYHTAMEKGVLLSASAQKMLEIMSDASWQPSDVHRVDSIFPNFAAPALDRDSNRMKDLLLKWENLGL